LLGKNDSIRIISAPWLWAEKNNQKLNRKPTICQLYERVSSECYIAANGDVYICCLDYNADVVFGNVKIESIRQIWNGQKRAEIMKNLRESSFEKIGLLCLNCM
jgi:radical SAM protein with 4Fe4S-binding SPASM domain